MKNVDKLVAAKLVELEALGEKELELIEGLSHHEIDAIVSAGAKFKKLEDAGEKSVRVVF